MAKPRRAARRRMSGRVVISCILIGMTAIATLAVWQLAGTEESVALPAAEESAVIETASTPSESAESVSATPTPAPPNASTTPTPAAKTVDWAAAVAACRETVRSHDAVISQAGTGIGHWSEHVRAQTKANTGETSVASMNKSFMRTRLLGPADVKAYRAALDTAAGQSAGCSAPKGAPSDIAATMGQCAKRLAAQKPALAAGARGMNDWSSHLAAMRRSKEGHVHNAQQVWINTWRAAPPHIKAFDKATAKFRTAPAC